MSGHKEDYRKPFFSLPTPSPRSTVLSKVAIAAAVILIAAYNNSKWWW